MCRLMYHVDVSIIRHINKTPNLTHLSLTRLFKIHYFHHLVRILTPLCIVATVAFFRHGYGSSSLLWLCRLSPSPSRQAFATTVVVIAGPSTATAWEVILQISGLSSTRCSATNSSPLEEPRNNILRISKYSIIL